HMLGVSCQVIAVCAVPEVGVRDKPDLLEQLEGPVDGRKVDSDGGLLDLGVDLFRAGMLEPGDGLQHKLALRSNPVAPGPQRVVPRPRHTPESSDVPITDLPVNANVP